MSKRRVVITELGVVLNLTKQKAEVTLSNSFRFRSVNAYILLKRHLGCPKI